MSGGILSGLYMALAVLHPLIWAWVTAVLVAMLFGYKGYPHDSTDRNR